MNKKIAIVIGALLTAVILLSTALGAFLISEMFTNHAGIQANGEISLWQDEACTVPLTDWDWGESWAANETLDVTVYVKSDANFPIWVGWSATGFPYLDSGVWFYHDGAAPFDLATSNFYFQLWQGGSQWRPDLAYLKPLSVGAKMPIVLRLSTAYQPVGLTTVDFTVIISSYSTQTG